jgi:hypothetical protein
LRIAGAIDLILSSHPVTDESLISFMESLRLNMPRLEVLKMVNWTFRQLFLIIDTTC